VLVCSSNAGDDLSLLLLATLFNLSFVSSIHTLNDFEILYH
jgi:hypothetical protein